MDYHKIYDQLVAKRKHIILNRAQQYCERHHIVPKAFGGGDEENNIVKLLPKEHLIAHTLLVKFSAKEYGKQSINYRKMIQALWFMQTGSKCASRRATGREYQRLRAEYSISISGKNARQYGKTGPQSSTFGMKHSEKSKRANREKHLNRKIMHHPETDVEVHPQPHEVQHYLDNGYVFGSSKHASEGYSKSRIGNIWIFNPKTGQRKYIKPTQLSVYEKDGFIKGIPDNTKGILRFALGRKWMNNKQHETLVKEEDAQKFLDRGYTFGRIQHGTSI